MPFGKRVVHLTTRSPSPTTIQYTVSNAPIYSSRLSLAWSWAKRLLNLLLALVFTLIANLQIDDALEFGYVQENDRFYELQRWWMQFMRATQWGKKADAVLTVLLSALLLYALTRRDHIEESLLLIRGLGVQISSSSSSYFATPSTRFISATQIQDIFIHEAFIGFEVRHALSIIVEGEDEAVVVFSKLLPRRRQLEIVWRGSRQVLWGDRARAIAKKVP